MTYRSAMLRSAWAAALWALACCASAAAIVRAFHLGRNSGYLLEGILWFGEHLDAPYMFVPGAAAAGAFAGVFGRYAELPPPRIRGVFIWLAFFPASGLGMGVYFWVLAMLNAASVIPLSGRALSPLEAGLSLPGMIFGVFLFGLPYFAPLIAVPLIGAAWSVEGVTRPADQPVTGLAKARNRALLAIGLIGVTIAGYAYAVFGSTT